MRDPLVLLVDFFFSPGFGGLMAGVAAYIGLRGVRERMRLDRTLDAQGSSLRRWWELAHYVDRQLERPASPLSLKRLQLLIDEMNAPETVFSEEQAMMGAWLSWKVYEKVTISPANASGDTGPGGSGSEGTAGEGTDAQGTGPEGTTPEGTEPTGTEPTGTAGEDRLRQEVARRALDTIARLDAGRGGRGHAV